jgi:hypothetical protein
VLPTEVSTVTSAPAVSAETLPFTGGSSLGPISGLLAMAAALVAIGGVMLLYARAERL